MGDFTSVSDLIKKVSIVKDKHINYEFQKYGYDLSVELNDNKHRSLYIKLAKEMPRGILEEAKNFVKDANIDPSAKGKLFMWKIGEIKKRSKKLKK